jgi:hypothetical protein
MLTLRTRLSQPPILILILTILGYGLLLPYTGFYWDDWPFAWIAKFLGPSEFIPAFTPFRPFLGPIFYATTSLIPPVPLYWQIFALVVRYLMGLATWWMFKQIWPEKPRLALTLALLLTIFPGYSQHWVAYTHINQELIPFLFFVLSFGYTFKALRAERPLVYVALAILFQICGIFPTEYFFGMEGLRALFLFSNFQGNLITRIRETLKSWWPYLLVWIINALWLVYYYRYGPYNSYDVTATNDVASLSLLPEIADTLWKVCFYIWGQVIVLVSSNLFAPSSQITIGLILIAIILLAFHSVLFEGKTENRNFALSLIIIGLIGILLGRLPSLAASLPLKLQSSYDRFMVSMMIGGSLFMVGLVELIFQNPRHRTIAISALIALGVGQQFFNANIFRRDWENQSEIYWQLTWRIPALEPNTVLLTHQMPIDYETDLSFTAPINWMYAPNFTPPDLPYALLYTEKRLRGSTLPSLDPGVPIRFHYRTVDFNSSTSQAVVIYKPGYGCLRVLDPARGDAELYSYLPSDLKNAIPLSSLPRIITNPENPASPSFLFIEPGHTWCYYFAKAELAYQMNDFAKTISLYEEATSLGYFASDTNELLIFVEAYAYTNRLKDARVLSKNLLGMGARTQRSLCIVWEHIQAKSQAGSEVQVKQILSGLKCSN